MMLGGTTLATVPLGGIQQEHRLIDAQAARPFTLEIGGVDYAEWFLAGSLSISDEQGQQQNCSFTLVDLTAFAEAGTGATAMPQPTIGARVRVLYYSEVLMAGSLDRYQLQIDPAHAARLYACECVDVSHLLFRRMLRQNFTNVTIASLVDQILDSYISEDGFSLAQTESTATLPLADAKDASIYDLLQGAANVMGMTFYVDHERGLHFVSTSAPLSPLLITESVVESVEVTVDREQYRNREIVFVEGTPANGSDEDALMTSVVRENTSEIAARQAIEGGSGLYEHITSVTHPISNDPTELFKLGHGTALVQLSLSGAFRRTVRVRVRSYGFRAGQVATVDLPSYGLSGTYVIQRASLAEEAAVSAIYTLELTETSALLRAYDAWLKIIESGKVIVMIPSSITNNLQTFNTPGSDAFVVPAGVTTVILTIYGASGGSGGGLKNASAGWGANGGAGGNGGLGYTVLSVTPGETLTIIVGAKGTGGAKRSVTAPLTLPVYGNPGTDGGVSYVQRGGAIVCQGNGGGGGGRGRFYLGPGVILVEHGTAGINGNGIGDAVTVGGGRTGGATGTWNPLIDGPEGLDGIVEVAW